MLHLPQALGSSTCPRLQPTVGRQADFSGVFGSQLKAQCLLCRSKKRNRLSPPALAALTKKIQNSLSK